MRHEALSVRGPDGFAAECVDIVRAGLAFDERPVVLAGSERLAAVTRLLGPDAAEVTFVPTDDHGRNPSRIMTMLHTFSSAAGGRHCLGVNQSVLAGRCPAAVAELRFSEFLFNDAGVAGWPLTLVCLYDADDLADETALEAMRQSHSVVRGQDENPSFRPDLAAGLWAEPLDAPPDDATHLSVGPLGLTAMRTFVRTQATGSELSDDRIDDLVLAANEMVTNSIRYGGGRADVAMWPLGGGVVCDVRDLGRLTDPLVGRITPATSAGSGRGMWLAHQLCDLVQVRSSAAGTTVRMYLLP